MPSVRPSVFLIASAAVLASLALPHPIAPAEASHTTPAVPCLDPDGCPDLVSDGSTMRPKVRTKSFRSTDCAVVEGMAGEGRRKLVQFTYTTPNLGAGDLIVGDPRDHPDWFTLSACHGHHHFNQYADYRLWTPGAFDTWRALRDADPSKPASQVLAENPSLAPVVGEKRGFCVIDIIRYTSTDPARYTGCSDQGISVGWADEYGIYLDGQWIDVTGLPRGSYVVEEEVNAEHFFGESDYGNNRAWATVRI